MSADRFWRTHDGMDALARDIKARASAPPVRHTEVRTTQSTTLPDLPTWALWTLLTVPALAILIVTLLIGGSSQ